MLFHLFPSLFQDGAHLIKIHSLTKIHLYCGLATTYSNHSLGLTDDNIVFVLCREERKWRKWVDNTFVHTLSPNIYRTASEAMQAFEYFTKQSNFGTVEKYTTYLAGPVVMYFVGKHVKNKYVIFLHHCIVLLQLCISMKTHFLSMLVRNFRITQQ